MLIILSWNVNGLQKRAQEVNLLIDKYKPDIIFLQETFLKKANKHPFINYQDYHFIRSDREEGKRGGLLTLIRSQIEYKQITLKLGKIENIAIKTQYGTLVNTYVPPRIIRKKDFKTFEQLTTTFLAAGDFNCQNRGWGDKKTTQYGTYLQDTILSNDLKLLRPNSPTRLATKACDGDSTLDIAVATKDVKVIIKVLQNEATTSDHLPILLEGNSKDQIVFYKLKTNWIEAAEELDRNWEMTEDLQYNVNHFTASCQAAILNNTTCIALKNRRHHLLPPEINALQNKKKELIRIYRRTRSKDTQKEIRSLTRKISAKLKSNYRAKIVEELEKLNDPLERWEVIKRRRPKTPPIPVLKTEDKVFTNNIDKAELLASTLEKKFIPTETPQKQKFKKNVAKAIKTIKNLDPGKIPQLTMERLNEELKHLKRKSAPGHDGISNTLLKLLPEKAKAHLLEIYRQIIKERRWPTNWKHALVTMLPKPDKDLTNPGSYRPISLLSCPAKLLERLILPHINQEAIPDHQFGFRPQHGCQQQLSRLISHLTSNLNVGNYSLIVSLDIEAAFDKVPHHELILKMKRTKQEPWITQLLASYYENRTFAIKINTDSSEPKAIKAGTAQGAVISPPIYSLYISDMPKDDKIRIFQYADDTLLLAEGPNPFENLKNMNKYLKKLNFWCYKWRVTINAAKSQAMIVTHSKKRFISDPPKYNNTSIPLQDSIKYLGIYLDRRLSFQKHVDEILKSIKNKTATLVRWIASKDGILPKSKITIFRTLVEPIMTYGLPAWQGASSRTLEPLKRMERKWIRMITFQMRGTPKDRIYEETPDINFINRLRKIRRDFIFKNLEHPNPLIRSIFHAWPDGLNYYPTDDV